MGRSPDVIDNAGRRLRRSSLLLAVCFLSALAPATAAPNGHDPRPQQVRSETHATTPTPAPGAAHDETPRPAAAVDMKTVAGAPQGAADSGVMYWLVAGAVTLGIAALVTAILLARTQAKLDAEKERREAIEKKYLSIYNNAPNGFHTLDLDGVVIDINDTEVGWLGYRREEILGRKYAEFLAEGSWTSFPESYAHLLRGEPAAAAEQRHKIIGKDSGMRMLALSPTLIKDDSGRVVESFWSAVDVSEAARLEQALDSEAHFDRVTNAHNRTFFFTLGEREIARARRAGGQLALLYLDIDDFKRINAVYGHFAGDRVLRAVCGVIAAALRNVDVFARIGDDEFAILLPDVGLEGATVVEDRLKRSLAATPVKLTSNESLEVRAAIGVSVYSASTQNLDALLLDGERDLQRARSAKREAARAPETAAPLETPAT